MPEPAQQERPPTLVAAGADVVVGRHAHRLLGRGGLDGAFVDYGLGNFAFYAAGPGAQTGACFVTVTGRHVDRYQSPRRSSAAASRSR